jgi:hypothetical protein
MRKQRELIEKQKAEQEKMVQVKKEEAELAAADLKASLQGKMDVMDIKVEDEDFEVDDI